MFETDKCIQITLVFTAQYLFIILEAPGTHMERTVLKSMWIVGERNVSTLLKYLHK